MAWTQIVNVGDNVDTPQGTGMVKRISAAQGTAHVQIEADVIEVPLKDTKPVSGGASGGNPGGEPQGFKVGDWVRVPEYRQGEDVREITGKKPGGFTTAIVDPTTGELGTHYNSSRRADELRMAEKQRKDLGGKDMPKEDFKPGDTVRTKTSGDLTVTKVQERGIWAQPKTGGAQKRYRRDQLTKTQPAGEPDQKFKKGDKVYVSNPGATYTSYERMAEVLGATKYATNPFRGTSDGMPGTVVNSMKDISGSRNIVLIENGDREYLVGEEGLTLVESAKEEPKETKETTKEGVDKMAGDLMGLFEVAKKIDEKIDQSVSDELKDIRETVKANQKLEIKIGDKTTVLKGKKHAQLETLITYSALRMSTLLVGMAGTGKTHAAEQVAEALDLSFYSMSVGAQTSKSDIIGYMDANGNYVKTFFREAYQNGGVFLMDEIDAGNANVLIQVNAALSNGLCAFPDMMVKKHPDFVFVASANTYGNGANRQYVGRNQLDAATLDRFAILDWKIDDALEEQLSSGLYGAAWYKTVRAVRDFVAEKGIRALISPRATQKGSQLLAAGIHVSEVINATLLGSVPEDKKADVIQVATRVYDGAAAAVPSKVAELIREEPKPEVVAPF